MHTNKPIHNLIIGNVLNFSCILCNVQYLKGLPFKIGGSIQQQYLIPKLIYKLLILTVNLELQILAKWKT